MKLVGLGTIYKEAESWSVNLLLFWVCSKHSRLIGKQDWVQWIETPSAAVALQTKTKKNKDYRDLVLYVLIMT
jgi:hypothetical protein